MAALTIGEAAARTGWSPRMLRYLEHALLVTPARTASGYRLYGEHELQQLRRLARLRRRFGLELSEVVFAARMRREPQLRAAIDAWLAGSGLADASSSNVAWVDWEQRKHERLLAA